MTDSDKMYQSKKFDLREYHIKKIKCLAIKI